MKTTEYSYTVGDGHNTVRNSLNGWTEGTVYTPHGMVEVYAQGDENNTAITALRFQWGKRVFVRAITKRYTHRGIATQAKRFASEIANAQADARQTGTSDD